MSDESESEKIRLEHEAAKLFMRAYEAMFLTPFRHIWHNKPRKPDVSAYLGDKKIDLEIAHLYGTEAQAMYLLGRELSAKVAEELAQIESIEDLHAQLLDALNRILAGKAQKHYDSERVWLVIRNANPAWSADDIRASVGEIQVPESYPFEQIWILGDWFGESGIVRLA